jgi:hypothetical protein
LFLFFLTRKEYLCSLRPGRAEREEFDAGLMEPLLDWLALLDLLELLTGWVADDEDDPSFGVVPDKEECPFCVIAACAALLA